MTFLPRGTSADSVWPVRPVEVRAASEDDLAAPLAPDVLSAVSYRTLAPTTPRDPRLIVAPLEQLQGVAPGELWISQSPVQSGRDGPLDWSCNDELMVVQMNLPDSALQDIEGATERLYGALYALTAAKGFPHILRTWNFLARINEGEGDAERYRRFCVGRHRVIGALPGYERRLPAATVIGMPGGGLHIHAVAAKRPGRQVESPVQMNPWRYPRAYGPQSPGFSRAMLAPWANGAHLLVSGTSSVLGHATVHAGDVQAQLRQTMVNLEALVTQPGLARPGFLPELYVLYLRNREDYWPLRPLLDRYFARAPLQVFLGDICRRDLLLEVEAIYRVPSVLAG